ncbi:hypothetical protein [Vibrio owensii]|uniref:hypothetical protein n=1 Tax=Vibrio owensii TaxID=696485 RepID=UPI003CC64ED4
MKNNHILSAKKLAKQLSLPQSEFNVGKDTFLSEFDSSFDNDRDRTLSLMYAAHYITNTENKNEHLYVRRLLDFVGDNPNPSQSEALAEASNSTKLARVRDALTNILEPVSGGQSSLTTVMPDLVHAVVLSDNDQTQSLALRAFEISTRNRTLDSELSA